MLASRFRGALGRARGAVWALLGLESGAEQREEIKSKQRELRALKKEVQVTHGRAAKLELKRRKKQKQQEIFELKLRSGKERPESEPGALPDFIVIGAMKGGTTFLYHLLTLHPLVEPAAKKELHYFDVAFDEGIEWYRGCFPPPRWKDGRRTITGEATPYMAHRYAPERLAEAVPEARLISLLRNPVDRAYSNYQQVVRKGREPRTFEEAVSAEMERPPRGQNRTHSYNKSDVSSDYLSRGVYVDQLIRWSKFFPEEQMLVLKSEDFSERTTETLGAVLDFLSLPEWEPDPSEIFDKRRNEGGYGRGMDPETRRRLEGYFGPHNRRLYEYLGRDLGW